MPAGRGKHACRTSLTILKMSGEELAALRATASRTPQASNGHDTETGASSSGENTDVFVQGPKSEYANEGRTEHKRA